MFVRAALALGLACVAGLGACQDSARSPRSSGEEAPTFVSRSEGMRLLCESSRKSFATMQAEAAAAKAAGNVDGVRLANGFRTAMIDADKGDGLGCFTEAERAEVAADVEVYGVLPNAASPSASG